MRKRKLKKRRVREDKESGFKQEDNELSEAKEDEKTNSRKRRDRNLETEKIRRGAGLEERGYVEQRWGKEKG